MKSAIIGVLPAMGLVFYIGLQSAGRTKCPRDTSCIISFVVEFQDETKADEDFMKRATEHLKDYLGPKAGQVTVIKKDDALYIQTPKGMAECASIREDGSLRWWPPMPIRWKKD